MADKTRKDMRRSSRFNITFHGEEEVARLTGLEPATPGVTGRYSNQLSYNRAYIFAFRHAHSRRAQDLGW